MTASPQCENGYTRIASELLEAICRTRLDANPLRVLFWITRSSYGWHRIWTVGVNPKSISGGINMSLSSVYLALKVLIEKKIIEQGEDGEFRVQKDYRQWVAENSSPLEFQPAGKGLKFQPTGKNLSSPLEKSGPGYKDLTAKIDNKDNDSAVGEVRGRFALQRQASKSAVVKPWPSGRAGEPYLLKTPLQRLMAAYKALLGVGWDNRDWDKHNFSKWSAAAKKLLDAFDGRGGVDKALDYLETFQVKMEEKKLSWNMATVATHAWDDPEVINAERKG